MYKNFNIAFFHIIQFREQELDVSFLMKSLNPLTWIEILRQVLVAAGFGSKNSLLRTGSFAKACINTANLI
jgi:hypothetical protein